MVGVADTAEGTRVVGALVDELFVYFFESKKASWASLGLRKADFAGEKGVIFDSKVVGSIFLLTACFFLVSSGFCFFK
jgi:hypothetical protein